MYSRFPPPVFNAKAARAAQKRLDDTRIAQPALGVVNLLATDILERFGVRPDFAAGHSYGEYAAVCVAGPVSRDDLLRLSAIRGRAVHDAGQRNPGGMAAVAADEAATQAALDELGIDASLANLNGPRQSIIAGTVSAIDQALERFPSCGLAIRRVAVTAAFHTPAMEAPARTFAPHLDAVDMSPMRIPVIPGCAPAGSRPRGAKSPLLPGIWARSRRSARAG